MGQTFVHQLDQNIPLRGGGFNIDVVKPIWKFVPERLNPEDTRFAHGEWCYDTPGIVSYVLRKENGVMRHDECVTWNGYMAPFLETGSNNQNQKTE